MGLSLSVCLLSSAGLIALVLKKPSVKLKGKEFDIYWLPAFLGGIILIVCGAIGGRELWDGLTKETAMNPLKILALFFSLTFVSVFLDELGFFEKLAMRLIKKTKGSQKRLFFLLYLTVSVLTVFTSNDIVVLTFTPFICCFCKEENISPLPYLIGEFVAANTWSMALMIGNPTNIYLTGVTGIGFIEYFSVMALPTLFGGGLGLLVLYLLFKKDLALPVRAKDVEETKGEPFLLVIGTVHLCLCILLLALSSYVSVPMWLVAPVFAVSLTLFYVGFVCVKKRSRGILKQTLKRLPYPLIPFVLSMFAIVLSLEKSGITGLMNGWLSKKGDVFFYGLSSYLCSNVLNNIPMSVLFGSILSNGASVGCVYASVIGSNLGALLTPVGALAGIMWMGLLKKYDVKLSFLKFTEYGLLCSLPSLLSSLAGLYLVI